ncbi:hypothetical protein V7251_22340 [Cytobacillus firmus]|nr:hypothetical protein [Cytobacillus firmus]
MCLVGVSVMIFATSQ